MYHNQYNPSTNSDQIKPIVQEYKDPEFHGCAMQSALREMEKRPPWLRSGAIYLVCFCPRCRRSLC